MSMYASGFNAHGQLHPDHNDDVTRFTLLQEGVAQILFAGWSTTVLVVGQRIVARGHQVIDQMLETDVRLVSAVGDHEGMRGCIDEDGRLYVVGTLHDAARPTLVCNNTDNSPRLGGLALAQNGRVALAIKQAPGSHSPNTSTDVMEFASFDALVEWYRHPSKAENSPESQTTLRGELKQLFANTANFVLLMQDGEVYTVSTLAGATLSYGALANMEFLTQVG